jgi:hypothetical protein
MLFIADLLWHMERDIGVYQVQQVMRLILASFPTSEPPAIVTAAAPDKNSHNSRCLLPNRTSEDSK